MNTLLNDIIWIFIIYFCLGVNRLDKWLVNCVTIMYDRVNQDDCGCSSCDCDDEPKINDFSKKTK